MSPIQRLEEAINSLQRIVLEQDVTTLADEISTLTAVIKEIASVIAVLKGE